MRFVGFIRSQTNTVVYINADRITKFYKDTLGGTAIVFDEGNVTVVKETLETVLHRINEAL